MKLGGWTRIGVVALIAWWAYCGFLIYQNNQIAKAAGYIEDPYAMPQLSGNDQVAANGIMADPPTIASPGMEVAERRTRNVLIGAFALPALLLALLALGRWIARGFRPAEPTSD